ncbi:MAG TPA: hypothetical protein VKY85_16850 [Candidatus Angelobacter sp.]|nr:hypothetical protein [Candidatus Angelobacter sp.]
MRNSGKKMASHGNGESNGKSQQPPNFVHRLISSVPRGRKGKHNEIVAKILTDLERLDMETAILVPLDSLNGEKMENVRSALNRATREKEISVATSADDKYFYVWRTQPKRSQAPTAANDRVGQTTNVHH